MTNTHYIFLIKHNDVYVAVTSATTAGSALDFAVKTLSFLSADPKDFTIIRVPLDILHTLIDVPA